MLLMGIVRMKIFSICWDFKVKVLDVPTESVTFTKKKQKFYQKKKVIHIINNSLSSTGRKGINNLMHSLMIYHRR